MKHVPFYDYTQLASEPNKALMRRLSMLHESYQRFLLVLLLLLFALYLDSLLRDLVPLVSTRQTFKRSVSYFRFCFFMFLQHEETKNKPEEGETDRKGAFEKCFLVIYIRRKVNKSYVIDHKWETCLKNCA